MQLGKLELGRGRLGLATAHLRSALRTLPGYVYALDALAQVELARGRLALATRLERRAVDTIPLPQFVGLYGDLLAATGHDGAARIQYSTEEGIRRLLAANGVRTDLETALFDVDHGDPPARLARRSPAAHSASGRRSTATTCSRGRSPATAAAARRSTTRGSRSVSARATPRSSSTARTSSAASATTRGRGLAVRRRSTRSSPSSGRRL